MRRDRGVTKCVLQNGRLYLYYTTVTVMVCTGTRIYTLIFTCLVAAGSARSREFGPAHRRFVRLCMPRNRLGSMSPFARVTLCCCCCCCWLVPFTSQSCHALPSLPTRTRGITVDRAPPRRRTSAELSARLYISYTCIYLYLASHPRTSSRQGPAARSLGSGLVE